jgi:hypothetical protein
MCMRMNACACMVHACMRARGRPAGRRRLKQWCPCLAACAQVFQPGGFASLNGTGLGVLEGLLGTGEHDSSSLDNAWVTPCPAGARVDGFQVVRGPLLIQIRPRCSCYNCGARCQRQARTCVAVCSISACVLRAAGEEREPPARPCR